MCDYSKPLMAENTSSDKLEELREQFLLLCQKASELRIQMRSSLEGHVPVRLEGG
jgi:hypothetical protein